jgi:hypothetical protein
VGIAPNTPTGTAAKASPRPVPRHGKPEGSTLLLTLGASLSDVLVCWLARTQPWLIVERLIERYEIPLNLDQTKRNRLGFIQR